MRRGMDNGWVVEGDKLIGLSLGADYCAEHEWGIADLKWALGIDGSKPKYSQEKAKYTKPHGIERRRISKHDNIRLFEHKDQVIVICEDSWIVKRFEENIEKHGIDKVWKDYRPRELGLWGDETLATAWDGGSFGILAKGDDANRLRELFKEIEANNVAIWNGGRSNPFQNGGLIIAIIDRVPAEHVEAMRAADEDAEKLQAASEATGIHKRLADAGKGFYACSASWFTPDFKPKNQTKETTHPVIFFLNPREQDENNSGWFTVEELDQWIKGEGPIPMKEGSKR